MRDQDGTDEKSTGLGRGRGGGLAAVEECWWKQRQGSAWVVGQDAVDGPVVWSGAFSSQSRGQALRTSWKQRSKPAFKLDQRNFHIPDGVSVTCGGRRQRRVAGGTKSKRATASPQPRSPESLEWALGSNCIPVGR